MREPATENILFSHCFFLLTSTNTVNVEQSTDKVHQYQT